MIRQTAGPFFAALIAALTLAAPGARAAVDIQKVETPGGLTAWLVENHDIPFTALEIRFRGGAALDSPEKAGATNLMSALIEEGSGDMDARALLFGSKLRIAVTVVAGLGLVLLGVPGAGSGLGAIGVGVGAVALPAVLWPKKER